MPSREDTPAAPTAQQPSSAQVDAPPRPDRHAPWLRDPELGVQWKGSWAAGQEAAGRSGTYEPRTLEQLFLAAQNRPAPPAPEPRVRTDEFVAWRGIAPPSLPWEEKPAPRHGRALAIGIVAGLAIGLAAWALGPGAREAVVTRWQVPVENLPAELEGLRIAQVSDLYAPAGATAVASAGAIVAREKPDVVVLTGDLLDGKGEASLAALATILGPFHGTKATIAVPGEHDLQGGVTLERLREALRAQGVTLLADERHAVHAGRHEIAFVGLGHPSQPERLAASGAGHGLEIWAAHAPNQVVSAPPKGWGNVALALAGHTRGGQIRLPGTDGLTPEEAAPFVAGWYTVAGRFIYVNRGLGTVGLPARLNSAPEVTLLTLVRQHVEGDYPRQLTHP